jgi:hypothetical protein
MASPNDVPRVSEPIAAAGGYVTRAWVDFFLKLASSQSSEDLAALYQQLAARVAELEEGQAFNFQILGQQSIAVNGIPQQGGVVIITLQNDVAAPGNTAYYGTGPSGAKGWFPVSGAVAVTADLTKSVAGTGVTTFGLADLANSGVGTLRAYTRDAKGRISGDKAATITGTTNQINVANGDASAGLPTLSLAAPVIASLAKADSAVQSVVAGTGIAVNNADPRNPVVSATGGTGTVTSVAAANATGITWSGSPITTSGTLTPTLATNLQILSTNTWTPEVIGKNFNLAGTDATEISLGVKNDGGGTAVFHYYTKPLSGLPLSGSIIGGAGSRPWDGTSWTAHSTAAYHLLASENQTPTASGTDFRIVATPIGTTQANRIVNSDFNGDGDIINSLGLTRRKINALERGRGIELVRTNNACEISMVSDLSTSTYQSLFRGYSIGGTIASPAATANNMGTGYALCGHDGTSYVGAKALVSLLTFAAWSNTSTPTTIVLETTATGSTARTARWFVKDTGHFYPGADNAYDMGTPTFRVRQYYGVNTSISTSDATLKTEPRDISDKEIDAFLEIGRLPMVWQWLSRVEAEGSKARIHSGPTVQAAIAVMQRYGLEWTDYAAFCYDEWEAHPEFVNEDGDVTAAAVPSGCRYSFRKEELIWWVMRAYIARQDRMEEKLNSL